MTANELRLLKPGDKVLHKDGGTGSVLSSRTITTVQHPDGTTHAYDSSDNDDAARIADWRRPGPAKLVASDFLNNGANEWRHRVTQHPINLVDHRFTAYGAPFDSFQEAVDHINNQRGAH